MVPFRTVELNRIGWTALLASGLAVGSVAIGRGAPPVALVLGPVGALVIARVVDHLRWSRSWTGVRLDVDPGAGERLVAALAMAGVEARYRERPGPAIRFRHHDEHMVRQVLEPLLGAPAHPIPTTTPLATNRPSTSNTTSNRSGTSQATSVLG